MKKGIHYWALPVDMSLEEKFAYAARCGFDGVEPVILRDGGIPVDASEKRLHQIRESAYSEGVEILSLTNSLNWECSFTSDSPQVRQKAYDTLCRQIDICHALGVRATLALPGFVSVAFPVNDLHPATDTENIEAYHPSMETIRYDRAWERALEGFGRISSYAEGADVTVCVENIWSNFLLSPMEMASFLDQVGSSHVKAYFDAGNCQPYGVPHHWIEILGERIGRVHIKDYRKGGGLLLSSFVELGKGDTDFSAVVSALRSVGYDGWVTAEVNVDVSAPLRVAEDTSSAMDKMLARAEEE